MADATDSKDVEGVEPSILVELLDTPKNAGGAKPRSGREILVGVPTLVTNEELVDLGAFAYRLVDDEDTPADSAPVETTNETSETPAAKPAEVNLSPVNPFTSSPGQSG